MKIKIVVRIRVQGRIDNKTKVGVVSCLESDGGLEIKEEFKEGWCYSYRRG